MRRKSTLLWLLPLLFFNHLSAQQLLKETGHERPKYLSSFKTVSTSSSATPEKCGFSIMMQNAVAHGFNNGAFENQVRQLVQRRLQQGRGQFTGPVTIPIIFHIVYRNTDVLGNSSANLSTSKFQAQVEQLNIDYANLAGSTWGAAADVPIRFCMAVVDTAGRMLAEPGIDRINGQAKGWSNTNTQSQNTLVNYFENTIKPGSIWDPYSYVNVWTAAMNSSGLLGYATFPSFSTLEGLDNTETNANAGVVINWTSVGSVANPGNSSAYGFGRTLTHELGHFFGLRHIWGDSNCGNDYCNDTPPQSQETSGCPAAGTLNGCTPSVPKMFQNYMDYSNDACLNTFTSDQSLRSQAVMDNSPRRLSLIASKACQTRASNSIIFTTAAPSVVDETSTATTCPRTKSYTFYIAPSVSATGAATINFTATGTAVQGQDFTIFPTSISYTAGDNSIKAITVNIIDDEALEATETLTLGFTITGTGVVAGPDKQSISLTITDNDLDNSLITINPLATNRTLLTQNFDTSTGTIPTGWLVENYNASTTSPNVWTVGTSTGPGISGRSAYITNNTVLNTNTYTVTNATDAYLFTPLIDATGLRDLNVTFKWRCRGELGYDAGYIGYVLEGQAPTAANVQFFDVVFNNQGSTASAATANLNLPADMVNQKFYFVFNWYNDESAGSNPPFNVDDIIISGKAFGIATAATDDTTFVHYSGQTVSYFSQFGTPTANRLIATLSNINQDAGCVTAAVAAAGNGRSTVNINSTSYNKTDKVIRLTPSATLNNPTFDVTLYFTQEELAVWGLETVALKMLGTTTGTPLAGPFTNANSQLVTPVMVNNSSNGYYSFKGSFSGNYTQFTLVALNSILPVSLLDFSAAPKGKVIVLQWSTAQEINNKGFVLERSTDARNFKTIAWVDGKGNSTLRSDYTYTDAAVQLNTLYYYRLRQLDKDNRETISNLRQARINESALQVMVSPVPAKDHLTVSLSDNSQAASISLLNAQGQRIKTWAYTAAVPGSTYHLEVSSLPAGIYLLQIYLQDKMLTQKVLIEK